MFLAVMLGAFGAHALRNTLSPQAMEVYKTANFYHFIHALGLFVVAWMSTVIHDPKIAWAGVLLISGIILFSGSLYMLSLTGVKWLGVITPLGGLSFLTGWILLFLIK